MLTWIRSRERELAIGACLLAAMWLTRSHDFTIVALPDVTWAAFFLAGMISRRWFLPIALTINAFAIDYVALADGVSDYCVTPAYAFLVPTHLWLWTAGCWTRRWPFASSMHVMSFAAALVLGVIGAFFISNASFYAFAGYFDDMSAGEYAARVVRYFPGYLESTAIYAVIGLLASLVLRWARQIREKRVSDHNEAR